MTNQINTTDAVAVSDEVNRIFAELFGSGLSPVITRAFKDITRLHCGDYPGYRASDTGYHNLQHTLDVTLAMARLMRGYERSHDREDALGARLFAFGVVLALFHDVGYLRRTRDSRRKSGAEYTLKHITRGAKFLMGYLSELGMANLATAAAKIIHFTGYERSIHSIRLPNPSFRTLGNLLGTADIIAQMSDRCYLEKCRDRLFAEFVDGGLAARDKNDLRPSVQFKSVDDLVAKTPGFYKSAITRLDEQLGGSYRYADEFGQNLYMQAIERNIRFAAEVAKQRDLSLLRRSAPLPDPTKSDPT